jgi:electron transfer flavoprotein alpha subunit
MKALLIAESREGKVLGSSSEIIAFSRKIEAECVMFMVGNESAVPCFSGTLYLADAARYGDYDPAVHKELILKVIATEKPDLVVFSHSSYGWDLAPRIAFSIGAAQVSEVTDMIDGMVIVPACNSKLRRRLKANSPVTVLTSASPILFKTNRRCRR